MIDKARFNETFQCFDKEMLVEIIDSVYEQVPANINEIEQSIENLAFVRLRIHSNNIKQAMQGVCEVDAYSHARKLEHAARRKIDEIIRIMLLEFPKILNNLTDRYNHNNIWIVVGDNFQDFLSGLIGPLSEENTLKLQELERLAMADGIPQMFLELKASSTLLLEELRAMKQELTSG